jgi:hypothetical protein
MSEALNEDGLERLMQTMEEEVSRFNSATEAQDPAAQQAIILRLAGIAKELDAIKSRQRAALAAVLDPPGPGSSDDGDRVAQLLRAFEFCAKLRSLAKDVLGDNETANAAGFRKHDVVKELDAMVPAQRSALAVLLDHPHPGVRVSAASSLVNSMPERAVPVLREVHAKERGRSAGSIAFVALFAYDKGQR